jgi:hypothetical protein
MVAGKDVLQALAGDRGQAIKGRLVEVPDHDDMTEAQLRGSDVGKEG